MGLQLGENMGNTVHYNNMELYNKSGTYTYFETDPNNACMIVITCDNLDTIEHILETMKKPKSNVNTELINMPSSDLLLTNSTVNSNDNTLSNRMESSADSANDNNIHTDSYYPKAFMSHQNLQTQNSKIQVHTNNTQINQHLHQNLIRPDQVIILQLVHLDQAHPVQVVHPVMVLQVQEVHPVQAVLIPVLYLIFNNG